MSIRLALTTLLVALPLAAQDAAATTAVALPAAGSPAAADLFAKACAKMQALSRGTFKTTEAQDSAIMRQAGVGFGNEDVEVDGGWNHELVWGNTGENDHYVRARGRMLVKNGDAWRLRGSKLLSGQPAPFTLDPALLFTLLQELPADARKVTHVEEGEVAGKKVAVLTVTLTDEVANEFADSGSVPGVSGGPGFIRMVGGGGGGFGMPDPEFTVDLALFVDPAGGDVLRIRTKVYEKNPMLGNIRIAVGGPGGGGGDDEEEEKEDEKEEAAATDDKVVVKKGLPERKLAKDTSMMYFKVDFQNLGMGEAPALDNKARALLGLQ
ncbi:MAG: hypothetical protein IPK26_08370 [Planctomycetes bacterium]|nr:hypothetical protein [Planctomycetota bacterium]